MRKLRSIKLLILLAVVAIAAICVVGVAYADWQYTSYNVTDNYNTSIYNDNWSAQSFLSNISIPFTTVGLRLYKVGAPGTLTVSIYNADINGKPTTPITSGTFAANTLTAAITGNNISVPVTPTLGTTDRFAVVLAALTGDDANYVVWLMDGSTPTYPSGLVSTSTDGGTTWTVNSSADAIFNVSGYPSFYNISSVKVFKNVFETGGQLYITTYNLIYPITPVESPQDLYTCWVSSTGRSLTRLGYFMTSIYFNESSVPGAWSSSRNVTINGSPLWSPVVPLSMNYTVVGANYVYSASIGSGLGVLYTYLMDQLALLETAWSMNLTYDDSQFGHIPNMYGAQILEEIIPGVGSVLPVIGWQLSGAGSDDIAHIDVSQFPYGNWSYQTELQGNLPAGINSSTQGIANQMGASAGWVRAFMVALFSFAIGGMVYSARQDSVMAITFASMPFIIAPLVGFLDFIWLAIAGFLAIVGAAFYIWGVGRG